MPPSRPSSLKCASSEGSDETVHLHTLILAFTDCSIISFIVDECSQGPLRMISNIHTKLYVLYIAIQCSLKTQSGISWEVKKLLQWLTHTLGYCVVRHLAQFFSGHVVHDNELPNDNIFVYSSGGKGVWVSPWVTISLIYEQIHK